MSKIIKNNIYRKSENVMNKYALFNNEEEVKNSFDNDFLNKKYDDLQDKICELCDADNICKFSQFEKDELELLENIKKELEENFDIESNQNVFIDDFVSKDVINKFKVKLSEIKKTIKTINFKIYYFESLKKQQVLNCNIRKSVEYGQLLKDLYSEQNKLNEEYDDSVVQLHKFQLDCFNKYKLMIESFCNKKQVMGSIKEIADKYSLDILKVYLTRKIVYLILQNFEKSSIDSIIISLDRSETFKNNFGFVYDGIVETLRCGNK